MAAAASEVRAPALSAESLVKAYPGEREAALDNVTLEIPKGSVVALVGPNGAGKTTLIRIWAGFEPFSAGEARTLGFDPWRERERALPKVGYVPQYSHLYRALSVADHLALAARERLEFDMDMARTRLGELGIRLGARAGALSGGEQAQVSLALALGCQAEVLLLDEPLASLDPLARRDMLALLVSVVRDRRLTVVISSHLVEALGNVCDRLVLLGRGRLLLTGTVEELLAQHAVAGPGATRAELVSEYVDDAGIHHTLVRGAPRDLEPGASKPLLNELVLAYLTRAINNPGASG